MAKLIGDGTIAKIGEGDASSVAYGVDTFLTIGCLTDASFGGQTKPLIDTTCIDSANRTYRTGITDADDATITVNYNPADTGFAEVEAAFAAGEQRYFEYTDEEGGVFYHKGIVTGVGSLNVTEGDKVTREITYKPLDSLTYTAPA